MSMAIFSIVVVGIMSLFSFIGLIDYTILKNRLELGKEFEKGFLLIGQLCLSMVGIISAVPLISEACKYSICILYEKIGLDPSMFIATIIANDMGGYQISVSIAKSQKIGEWAGSVYAAMMGCTIIFSIPVGLSSIKKEDTSFFAKGILFGIASIPFGAIVGGLIIGVPIKSILINLIPPIILSIIIMICLIKWPNCITKAFKGFAFVIRVLSMLFLGIAMIKDLVLVPIANTGAFDITKVPFIKLFNPTKEGLAIAGNIGLVLSGALPLVLALNKILKKQIEYITVKYNKTEYGIMGFLLTSANNMAMFTNIEKMNDKEKIYNVAFSTGAAFVIGDHLAFTASVNINCILPMMVSKLISGILSVLITFIYFKVIEKKEVDSSVINKEVDSSLINKDLDDSKLITND